LGVVLRIEVVSDIVCPWCYVGKRRLDAALNQRPQFAAKVVWLPFELNPEMPDAGMPRDAYLLARFGDTQRFAAAQQQLIELGATLDIDFRFDGDRHMPNTRACHLLLRYAAWYDERHETCLQHALKERLLAAYFTQGRNLSERETLVEIACDAGFERSSAEQALDDVTLRAEVIEVERELQSLGVSGVPTYIFERKFAFSGAQPVDVFLAALDRAAAGEQ
jgi:predicted DsbA family dithiol-disulfide isomerase